MCRVLRRRRPDAHGDRRSHRIPRVATARCAIPRPCGGRGCPARSARRWIRAPQCRWRSTSPTEQEREIVFRLGAAQQRRRRQPAGAALPRIAAAARSARGGVAALAAHAGRRAGGNARRRAQRADQWLADLSDDRVPPVGAQRLLPVGRRLRFPRPVAGRDGAGARRAALLREQIVLARADSSSKATCSTGGTRPRAAACARIAPTIIFGCRWRPAATSSPPATPAMLDETSRFLEGRPVNAEDDSYYDLPGRSDETRDAL